MLILQRRPVGRKLLASLHNHAAPRRQAHIRAHGPSSLHRALDAGFEVFGQARGVMVEDLEDVVIDEGVVGFGVDEKHVDDAGGEEGDGEGVGGEDEVLRGVLAGGPLGSEGRPAWGEG